MRLVMKFGGGLLTSKEGYRNCATLVRDIAADGNEVVVVVSAMGGVTDRLVEALFSREGEKSRRMLCDSLRSLHLTTAGAGGEGDTGKIAGEIEDLIGTLEDALAKYARGDRTARRSDEISSMGERLSAPIFAHYLEVLGVPAKSLTGGEAGIRTDSNFGNASPDMLTCRKLIEESLGCLLDRGITPVVTGFMAENAEDEITTLGRGGSDYTTSIIGTCLGADEIWIWKDVCGIMTANPKVVPEAKTIPLLSYSEAAELAHFGASVLHPRTMEPAMRAMIPIRVKDATHPDLEGTLIGGDSMDVEGSVKAVTSIDRVGLVSISGTGMAGVPGVASRVFDSIAQGEANVMMISQSSSETNITIVVPRRDLKTCRTQLEAEFEGNDIVNDIIFDEEVAIISVVGSGMRGTPGVASRVFKAVADARINVMMIAQGSSEVNISFVVDREDALRAVTSIHREFRLDELFGRKRG